MPLPQKPLRKTSALVEIREASHITSDLSIALGHHGASGQFALKGLRGVEMLISEGIWWTNGD